jgi:hypothetical protein
MTKTITDETTAHVFTFNQDVLESAFIGLIKSDTDLTRMTTSGLRYVESTAITLWSDLFGSKQPNYVQIQNWSDDWYAAAKRCALSDEVRANVAASVELAETRYEELSQSEKATKKQRDSSEKLLAIAESAAARAKLFRRRLIDQWKLLYNFETPLKDGGTVTTAEEDEAIKDAKADLRELIFGKNSSYRNLSTSIRASITNAKTQETLEFIQSRYIKTSVILDKLAQAANWVKPTSE